MAAEFTNNIAPTIDVQELCFTIAESSPMPMAELDGTSRVIRYVNPAFCLLTFKSKDELLGKTFADVAGEEAECLLLIDRVYRTGKAEVHTGEEHAPSHSLYWSYVIWPVLGADKRPLGVILQVTETAPFRQSTVAMNQALMLSALRQQELKEAAEQLFVKLQVEVLDRALAQQALRESEGRYRALVTASADVVYRMSPDWGEMRQLYGRGLIATTEQASKAWLQDYIHPDDQAELMAAIREAARTKSMFFLEHRVRRVNGALGWISSRAVPLLDDAGEIVEWFGTATDVTERKRSETKLDESAERLRFVMESMPQKIFTATPSGEVDYLNTRWMEFSGLSFDEIRDWGWTQFIHPDDVEENVRVWKYAIEHALPFRFEQRFRRKDGQYRWHLSNALPALNEQGEVLMWIGSNTDIHDQKQAEASLVKTEKLAAVGRLAASIAHEINNPLDAVMNTVYLAKTDPGISDSAREHLQTADAELRRIAHITRQTLGFYRESSAAATFLVQSLLDSVIYLLEGRVKAKNAKVNLRCDSGSQMHANFGELRQVVSNLVINSLDAVPQGGMIKIRVSHISARTPGNLSVRITVADTGRGISNDILPQIFDPFFTTKGPIATGLGLYVSKQLIEQRGGKIQVRSSVTQERSGTVFSIILPVGPSAS